MPELSDWAPDAPNTIVALSGPDEAMVTDASPRAKRSHDATVALGLFLALALVWYRSVVIHMASKSTGGLPGDPASIVWALEWFPHALLHGQNLLHSKAMWAPTGIDLGGVTGVPLLAMLMAPITWLWGPIVAYNVITIAAPALTAWSAYFLCRYVTRSHWPALLAGAIYGFGTYEIAQNAGHVQLSMALCPALLALVVLRFLDGVSSKRRFGIELVALLVAQMFIGTEVFFTMTLIGFVALALAWYFAEQPLRSLIVSAVPILLGAYIVAIVFSSWYVYELLAAPAYAKGSGLNYPTDLLAFITPEVYTWVGGHAFVSVSELFKAGPGETNAYLGLPLVLVVLGFLVTRWRRRTSRFVACLLLITVVWVLGSRLYVHGQSTVWLPYSLFAKLPWFDEVMQGRVALYIALICVVVLSVWLATPGHHRALRWLPALLALAFVLPNLVHPFPQTNNTWTNPVFFKTDMYQRYLHKGETIMPISWTYLSESPMWQAEDHMYYNMASGYFLTVPPAGWRYRLTWDLWRDTPHPLDARLLRRFIAKRNVEAVVVQQAEMARWSPTLQAAGLQPSVTIGGVTLYRVPTVWLTHTRGVIRGII